MTPEEARYYMACGRIVALPAETDKTRESGSYGALRLDSMTSATEHG